MIPNDLRHTGFTEALRRGLGTIRYDGDEGLLLCLEEAGIWEASAPSERDAARLAARADGVEALIALEESTARVFARRFGLKTFHRCHQVVYEGGKRLPLSGCCEIRPLTPDYAERLAAVYEAMPDPDYFRGRMAAGLCFGAFADGRWAGFAGVHDEGTMGFLQVHPEFRRRGIGEELERFLIDLHLDRGWTPYGHVFFGNDASLSLQRKLGLSVCPEPVCWYW